MSRKTDVPAVVRQRGQVTVPADVRKELGLQEGDYVLLDVEPLGGGSGD